MGFWSSVCSFCSSICSGIGSAISAVATGLSSALSLVTEGVSKIVCGIIKGIAAILGIGKEKEKPEELGLRAEKAERNLEEFDSFEEYKEYLDGIELTDKDLEKLNDPDKKEAYSLVGNGIYLKGINEHYGMEITPDTLIKLVGLGVKTPEDTKAFLDKCKENKVNPDLAGLEKGELSNSEQSKLVNTLKESVVGMSNEESISSKLDEMLSNL